MLCNVMDRSTGELVVESASPEVASLKAIELARDGHDIRLDWLKSSGKVVRSMLIRVYASVYDEHAANACDFSIGLD